MYEHKILKYTTHRLEGTGWWEGTETQSPTKRPETYLSQVIKALEKDGWEVCSYSNSSSKGSNPETIIFKRPVSE